jgi:hypothetical protein
VVSDLRREGNDGYLPIIEYGVGVYGAERLTITRRDQEGVQRLLREIRESGDDGATYMIRCFNESEAMWIREQLELAGVDGSRLHMTWLVWPGDPRERADGLKPRPTGGET